MSFEMGLHATQFSVDGSYATFSIFEKSIENFLIGKGFINTNQGFSFAEYNHNILQLHDRNLQSKYRPKQNILSQIIYCHISRCYIMNVSTYINGVTNINRQQSNLIVAVTSIITDTLNGAEIRQLGEVQEAGARAPTLIVSDIVLPPTSTLVCQIIMQNSHFIVAEKENLCQCTRDR